ncbi:MAG: penicillin acylase family protein [Alphaproteobacteria bacterium]|nr:MAG: penicillin acylase family protein [Alphaproteobacteria bacterium]
MITERRDRDSSRAMAGSWTKRILTGVTVLAGLFVLVAIAAYAYLRTGLPQTDGTIRLSDVRLDGPIEIRRDDHGIPHIIAKSDSDAFFALGFVHAQDRLWQLEMNRRIASGRLAEILGRKALPTDIFLRTLSTYDRARAAWAHLDPETRNMLKAYADGINAWIAHHRGAWPPEFLLAGVTPELWTPIDTIGWLKMMDLDLGGNYRRELARLDLLAILSPTQVQQFFPPYPGEKPLPLPDPKKLYDGLVLADLGIAPGAEPAETGLGSNNWVVSGSRTKSGLPLLANDPHLRLNTPSLWYLAAIRVGEREVVGASMPGVPFVILGRNRDIAWGFTNTGPDVQDLYLERIEADGRSYLTPEGPAAMVMRSEKIAVKNGQPVTITVRETRHGPVISDAIPQLAQRLPKGTALALRWTALADDDTGTRAGLQVTKARNFEEFTKALQAFIAPEQNIVYADRAGHIGYYAPARVPIRGPANDTHGLLPAPGWKPGYDWQGFIAYDELPRRYDPPEGLVVTANQKIIRDDYPHYLTSEWALPYRADRIRALLEATPRHDTDSFGRIQMDVRSTVADDLLPLFLDHLGDEPGHGEIVAAMRAWDREMVTGRAEPLIFTAWHRHVARRIYADELGKRFERYYGAKPRFLHLVLSNAPGGYARWCDDVRTKDRVEDCDAVVREGFRDALEELAATNGKDWKKWQWGAKHKVVQEHRPFSAVAWLAPFFETKGPTPGGTYTVNVAPPLFKGAHPYRHVHGPSYRAIYDLADPSRSRFVIPTGQSGHPLSRHYRDLFDLWREGRYLEVPVDIPSQQAAGILRIESVLTEN